MLRQLAIVVLCKGWRLNNPGVIESKFSGRKSYCCEQTGRYMAGHLAFALDADSLMPSSVNSSLDEDTTASPFIAPGEHAISLDIAKMKGVLSSHDDFGKDFLSPLDGSDGSNGIRMDSKGFTAEAGNQAECRICHEEDDLKNLETPCACSGSMKHAQRICLQSWCDEKGNTNCEICHQPYKNGYEAHWLAHVGYDFVLCFCYLVMMITFVLLLQAVVGSESAFWILLYGAGSVYLLRYVMATGVAQVIDILRRRRLRHEVAMSAYVTLAMDLLEHRITAAV